MDSNVQSLCLIALGVGFLILIAAALLLSVLRGSVFGLGMMVMRMISEPQKEETTVNVSVNAHSAAEDLRAKAQSLDFDAAVAKYRQDEGAGGGVSPDLPFTGVPPIQPPDPRTQGFPPPDQPPRNDADPLQRQ